MILNNIQRLAAITAGVAAACSVQAQTLTKEIVIEREVEPAERAATRPASVSPILTLPKIKAQRLTAAEYTGTPELSSNIPTLKAAAWRDSVDVSPYRGYVSGGYFPVLNFGLSAGYRIINKPKTQVDAWLQYNGDRYTQKPQAKSPLPAVNAATLSQHTGAVGVNAAHSLGTAGRIEASGHYSLGSVAQPVILDNYTQNLHAGDAEVRWYSAPGRKWQWEADARIGGSSFGKAVPSNYVFQVYEPGVLTGPQPPQVEVSPLHEVLYGMHASATRKSHNHAWSLEIAGNYQRFSHTGTYVPDALFQEGDPEPVAIGTSFVPGAAGVNGLTTIMPKYSLSRKKLKLEIGIGLEFVKKIYSNKVTPEIVSNLHLTYAPTSMVAMWLNVEGGNRLNHVSDIYGYNPYIPSNTAYGITEVNSDMSTGVTLGPWKGVSIQLWGGYSKAENAYVPVKWKHINWMAGQSVSGWMAGGRVDWQLRDFVQVYTSVQATQSAGGHGYYMWRDNAKLDFQMGVTTRPIKNLEIGTSFNMRTGRHAYQLETTTLQWANAAIPIWDDTKYKLGNVNNLRMSVSYQLMPALTLFTNVDNVLARRWLLVPGIQCQGIHGLVGATFKF